MINSQLVRIQKKSTVTENFRIIFEQQFFSLMTDLQRIEIQKLFFYRSKNF